MQLTSLSSALFLGSSSFLPVFAVLHVADFALQAQLRAEPGLADSPVALLNAAERNAFVAACTPAARTAGVEPGQSAPQALARCATLLVRTPHAALEAEARAGLLAAAFSLSPAVEMTSPGVCTMDIAGLARERREPALLRALAELNQLGLYGSAGLGATPLLALYAARQAAPLTVAQGDRAFLAPLPVAVAGPPPELAQILDGWGIKTLGQLTHLAKADVTHRLGVAGLALWERAAGETTRPLHLVTPPREFIAALDCEHELETLEPLLFILRRFVDRLVLELRNASLAAIELHLRLDLTDDTHHARCIRLPEPLTDPDVLFRTLHAHLENVRTAAPLCAVRLKITPGRVLARQHGLFDSGLRDPHGFADTLARVAALVGSDRVGTPRMTNTHRPDVFSLSAPAPNIPPISGKFTHPPHGLVLRRYRPPVPARVELAGSRPDCIWTDGQREAVGAIDGPWRGSGDWWQGDRAWQREEWDVELAGGGLYRLLHTPEGWFLEGEYD
jgi:protein ImuB